jgi:hypothetical protein
MCLKQNEDGLHYVDFIDKEMVMVLFIVQAYCADSIEFDDIDEDSMYDFCMSGLWQHVRDNIPEDEYKQFVNFVDDILSQEMKLKNSVEGIVARGINKLIDKIPTDKQLKSLAKSLVKDMKGFNWDSLPMLKEIYQSLNEELDKENKFINNKNKKNKN